MGKKKGEKKAKAPVSDDQAKAVAVVDSQADAKIESETAKPEAETKRDLSVPHADVCTPEAWGMQDPFARRCVVCKAEHEVCYAECGEYKAMLAAAKTTSVDKKKGPRQRVARPSSGGKVNAWGHRLGSQAHQIDDLLAEGLHTAKEIAEMVETTKGRVDAHVLHLRVKKGIIVAKLEGRKLHAYKPAPQPTTEATAQ